MPKTATKAKTTKRVALVDDDPNFEYVVVPEAKGPMLRVGDPIVRPTPDVIPLDYMCLIRLEPISDTFEGTNLLMPDGTKERQQYAGVRATLIRKGENACTDDDGRAWAVQPAPGDRITIKQYGGEALDASRDELYRLVTDKDILAVGWL